MVGLFVSIIVWIVSIKNQLLNLVYPIILVNLMMTIYPVVDPVFMVEIKVPDQTLNPVKNYFIMKREMTIKILLVLVNFLFSKKYSLPMNLLAGITCSISLFYNDLN